MSDRVRAAFYGDDFTGSVDALLQFERRGWKGRLLVGLPGEEALSSAAEDADVVGIAGIARSLGTDALEAEVAPALRALAALRPDVLQYKACSTADSSPEIGSLGRVVELGREIVAPERAVPALFAQPDFGRYTVFGHHFAAEDGIVHRLDRQPTMSTHPSTPMTESDLAVHLSRQTELPVRSIPFTAYSSADAVAAALAETDAAAAVLDALDDTHLEMLGAALALLPSPVFAIGSGGLSHAVATARPGPGADIPLTTSAHGPVLAVSGSRSPQTRRQVEHARAAGWLVAPLDLGRDADTGPVLDALASGRCAVLTSDDADTSGTAPEAVLETIAEAAAGVILAAARADLVHRVVVCGGDTSSRVTRLLGIGSLSIAANPWANVVLLRAHAADPAIDGLELLLKGGQVGEADLLVRVSPPLPPR